MSTWADRVTRRYPELAGLPPGERRKALDACTSKALRARWPFAVATVLVFALPFAFPGVLASLFGTSAAGFVVWAVFGIAWQRAAEAWVERKFRPEVRRRLRAMIGHLCHRCGYDLTGNVSGVCPECGTKLQEAGT